MKWARKPISTKYPEPFWKAKGNKGAYEIFKQKFRGLNFRVELNGNFLRNARTLTDGKRVAEQHDKGERMKNRKKNPEFPLRGSRKATPDKINLRNITLAEAKELHYGQTLYTVDRQGRAANIRVGSAVKRWKRDADRIEVTFKFGLYESFRLNTEQILNEIYVEA